MFARIPWLVLLTTLLLPGLPASAADFLPGKSSTVGLAEKSKLRTERIEYHDGDQLLEGYLAWDASRLGRRPGVLVVHEWTGINDHTRAQTEKLAKLGYVALAVDVYGKGVRPKTPEAASAEAAKYKQDRALFRSRLLAGHRTLLDQSAVDPQRTAAVGYCFGGTGVLELARSGADLDGVVSVHGGLDSPTPSDGQNIKARVLLLHGAADPFVKPADIEALLAELRGADVDWQMVSYGGAVHAFTNPAAGDDPSTGAAYDARADRRSWAAMRQFLDEVLH
ncbi:MAG TPA: dienelactone hydrolase [Gammaproteobacteria bacterium]|uniref:dienelactone hydrolase family protein n=1 Tax=Immundisolibacter sp. TaxID=1934948 RepID=UPI000E950D9A|nr:dienelactone hydrolase [Gammaproteobacteria bacterium]MCH78982.1 dienelactone hydrolase [Gammaproteobacteria bacterium]